MATEDLYARACQAVERNNLDWAIRLLREVLKQKPDYPDARAVLRSCERRRLEQQASPARYIVLPFRMLVTAVKSLFGGPEDKLETYEDLLEKEPNNFWALCRAAKAARAAGYTDVAVEIYRDALHFKPENKKALRAISDTLAESGQTAEAVNFMSRLVALEPENRDLQGELRNLEASSHMEVHRYDEAESFRDTIRDKELAEKLEESQRTSAVDRLEAEIVELERELQENPTQVSRILRLARLYKDTGQLEKARDLLKEKHKLIPDNYEIREELGDVQLRIFERDIKQLGDYVEENPNHTEAAEKLQELKQTHHQFALREYTWRHKQHPTDRDVQQALGEVNYELGNYNDAISAFQILSQDARYALQAHRMLGLCFMAKEQYDLAIEQFDRALEIHPDMDDKGKQVRYNQAQAYEKAGQRDEALRAYKQIYSQDINFRDVSDKVEALSK